MQVLHSAETILFCLTLLFAAIFCHDKNEMLEVVGFIKHPEFAESWNKTSLQTFSGFHVTIGCRSKYGTIKSMGFGEINKEDNFQVFLPREAVKHGVIKKGCYAQVHSASADTSCPLKNNQEAFKIFLQYKSKKKTTIRHSAKLIFSPISCTSKFLWPFRQPKLTHILSAQLNEYPPSPPPISQETPLAPYFSPSNEPVSTLSPPQPEDLPPAVSPAKHNPPPPFKHPLPLKHDPPAFAPAVNPAKHNPPPPFKHPLPLKPYSPAFAPAFTTPTIPKSKQPPLPKHIDFSPAPAPSFDTPASLSPDDSSPLGPSPNGNDDYSSDPFPGFDTPASPLPDEPLPLSPSPNANKGSSPAPSFDTPAASPLPEKSLPLGPSPDNEDFSPAPAPSFHKPASPLPDKPLPLGPSHNGNVHLSPAPTPSFHTPDEPLRPSPSPLANNIPFPPHIPNFRHVPSFKIPQPPPIPSLNKPSPPTS